MKQKKDLVREGEEDGVIWRLTIRADEKHRYQDREYFDLKTGHIGDYSSDEDGEILDGAGSRVPSIVMDLIKKLMEKNGLKAKDVPDFLRK